MAATLVDANVLLDVLTEDPVWLDWSLDALATAAEAGPLVINPIVYAEVSVRFSRIEALVSPSAAAVGCSFPRGEGLPRVPPSRRHATIDAARLLHRRSCRRERARTAHA
jgi:predicted nucleic acid-binding protein